MKNLLSILLFCSTFYSSAQNIYFIKSYGNSGYDYGRDIKQDVDTGYIATGSSSSFSSGTADAFLLKVDSLGNFKWSYNYGGQESDWGESVVVTNDSSYAIGGYTNSYGAGGFDFYLIRTNNVGEPLWEKTYGGSDWDRAHSLIQLPDSGFVLTGETHSFGNGNSDAYIIRTDKNGDTLWTRTFGGTENDYANSVILDGDSLVVGGGTESFGAGMTDGLILKYHINGTLGWSKFVGKERDDYFTSIAKNNFGEYFLGGTRHYYYDQTGYLGDFWIYNMLSNGINILSDTSLTGGSHELEIAHDIVVDENDNIFFGGETKSFGQSTIDGYKDAFLGKLLNTYYQTNFVDSYGEGGEDNLFALDNCYDKGLVGIGNLTFNNTGGSNLYIMKIDATNSLGGFQLSNDLTSENITLSIENNDTKVNQLDIYPNYVENNINLEGVPLQSEINLYDISGKLIKNYINTNNQIELSGIKTGMYVLEVLSNGNSYTFKIVKN
jgi:hypothetical protein